MKSSQFCHRLAQQLSLFALLPLLFVVGCSSVETTNPNTEGEISQEFPISDELQWSSNLDWSSHLDGTSDNGTTLSNNNESSSSSQLVSSSSVPNTSIADLLTKEQFEKIYPITNPADEFYNDRIQACAPQAKCRSVTTYEGLIEAAGMFDKFVSVGSINDRKRELAAFFANVTKETTGGWETAPGGSESWGLCFCEEVGGQGYTDSNDPNYQAVPGQSYHGRGALQISYPYNYGPVSEFLYNDKNVLLQNPERIVESPLAFWGGSIWFWTVKEDVAPGETPPQGTPSAKGFDNKYYKPSCHMAMTGDWTPRASDVAKNRTYGLGVTINVINGGLECNSGWDDRGKNRVKNYRAYTKFWEWIPSPATGTAPKRTI